MEKRNIGLVVLIVVFAFSLTGIAGAEAYKLHVDDQLVISVWGHEDLSREVVVGPDGNISYPLIGEIEAEGLTVPELNQIITKKLAQYIKDPVVNITLKSYQKMSVMVLGEVIRPGTYKLDTGRRVLDAISMAGGPGEVAELTNVRLTRGDKVRTLDLEALLKGTSTKDNIILKDGDTLFIPKSVIEVTIMGEVTRPGRYQLERGLPLTDLLAKAGGLTEYAAPTARYTTEKEMQEINLEDLMEGKLEEIVVKDGDALYIPRTTYEVTILGEVNRPGSYPWQEGLDLVQLLARAGNHTKDAELAEVKLVHKDKTSEILNLEAYFEEGKEEENPELKPGDIVMIEEDVTSDSRVTILGEVNRPGSYAWDEEMQLVDLLAVAGNQTERGDLEKVKIVSTDNETTVVNLEEYFQEGNSEANPLLKPGDIVMVEEKEESAEVTILGEVNRPGSYEWHENLHLVDLLAKAGNQTERGNIEKVKILHTDGSSEMINLQAYFHGKGENPLLRPGDVVRIEEIKSIDWQKVFTFVSGLNLLKDFLEIDW